ncbi:hypothetical protein DFH06DRAFT_1332770 [Mycena polygramma]|nr:hypothetical protein DFH06DRAFT_1335366 [Mycena polygramma]KAJ7646402.1 hypothetical protein DFH06DRAFT_1332770 [Mycena polygramma]
MHRRDLPADSPLLTTSRTEATRAFTGVLFGIVLDTTTALGRAIRNAYQIQLDVLDDIRYKDQFDCPYRTRLLEGATSYNSWTRTERGVGELITVKVPWQVSLPSELRLDVTLMVTVTLHLLFYERTRKYELRASGLAVIR